MRGRQVFMQSMRLHGSTKIFGNPGTTENPLLESLLEHPEVEYITALHEGVAVCAAGFYAQATGLTPVANVHVAPGLGNAIGMMYGCLKARVPVVVTAGQQDTRMRLRDPLLRHDLVEMAAPVVKWSVEPQSADEIGPMMRRAFQIANEHPKGPVFVALPNNVMEQETDVPASTSGELHHSTLPHPETLQTIAEKLIEAEKIAVCVGDDIAREHVTAEFLQFVEQIGAAVFADFLLARRPIATDHPHFIRGLATDASQNRSMLAEYDAIVVVGGVTMEEIWFEQGSSLPERAYTVQIESDPRLLSVHRPVTEGISGDLGTIITRLSEIVADRASDEAQVRFKQNATLLADAHVANLTTQASRFENQIGTTPMAATEAMSALASALPQDVVIVDESITASADVDRAFRKRNPDEFFAGRGGGIGQGIAGAIGTAVALPEKQILAISGDGSAMYSIQALWTAAHHKLNIFFVILANAEYRVLKHNLDIHRQRFDAPSDQPYPNMDLINPTLDFSSMATGMGIANSRADTTEEIIAAAESYLSGDGPYLLEIAVAGKD
ncbi:MAG: thiamine pyrophosphate-binding protein [Pseudomonadales bacterium]|nr:thiamine pyrophosphate-binding protein [Pseudomonadales bacterium]